MSLLADKRILIVDDLPSFCQELRTILKPHCRQAMICGSPLRALRLLRTKPFDLLIITLVMQELGGFAMIRRVRGQNSQLPIIMITGYGNENTAIEATRLGVSDYLEKPVDPDELCARMEKIFAQAAGRISPTNAAPRAPSGLISSDTAMLAIFDTLRSIAASDSRVLILGETGTGKQLIAQAIHAYSPRRHEPLVDINCAAIPENLLESELFGHERGAFTGATERRTGRFEEAGAGTLFLDEIGEISLAVQAKLLRVLQDGRYNRVGGTPTLTSRARVIAATNRHLQDEVKAGRFRADLFYRLQVINLSLPPLRRRRGDIPLLVDHFLRRFRERNGGLQGFRPDAVVALQRYNWPGNIRELEHFVERFAVLHERPWIEYADLPSKFLDDASPEVLPDHSSAHEGAYNEARLKWERSYLETTLQMARGNMAEAARQAKMDRSHFFRLVKKHDLDASSFS